MNDDDLIVQFRPREPTSHEPLPVEPKPWSTDVACKHERSFIDREARLLTCQKCGVALDPIEKLFQLAMKGRLYDSRIAEIREFERKRREEREREIERKKERVATKLRDLKSGDMVILYDRRGHLASGKLIAVTEDEVQMQHQAFKVVEIVDVRRQAK